MDLWYGISFSKHLTIFGPINDGPEIFGPLYDGPEIFVSSGAYVRSTEPPRGSIEDFSSCVSWKLLCDSDGAIACGGAISPPSSKRDDRSYQDFHLLFIPYSLYHRRRCDEIGTEEAGPYTVVFENGASMSVQRDDTTLTISNVKGIRDLPHIKSPHDAH